MGLPVSIGKPPKGVKVPAWASQLVKAVTDEQQGTKKEGKGVLGKMVTEGALPMDQPLLKKPMTSRLKDTFYLIKHSFKVFGKDADLFTPLIKMFLYSLLYLIPSAVMVYFFISRQILSFGLTLYLVAPLYLFLTIYGSFFYTRQQADQSWIAYNAITGKNVSYREAREHTRKLKPALRLLALIDLLGLAATTTSGKGGIISRMVFGFLREVADIAGNFLIPVVVIEKKSLQDAVPQLKALKRNIPATLMGAFGFDFAGDTLIRIVRKSHTFFILVGVWIGTFSSVMESFPGTVIPFPFVQFSLVPVFFTFFIADILSQCVKDIVRSLKVIYYTIFYTAVMQPKKLSPDIRKEVTKYLKLE